MITGSFKDQYIIILIEIILIDLNRKEKEQLIVDLYSNGSTYREIAQKARISLRDIKGILDKANGVQSLSKSSQAYQMFSEGKSPMEVAIALNMRESEVTQLYKESWTLKQIYDLNSIYLETKGDLASFVRLYKLGKESGLNAEHVVSILRLVDDNTLSHLEEKYRNLKLEVESLEEMTKSSIRTLQDYDTQLDTLGKSFDNYCQLCQEQEVKLNDLQNKRLREEALVRQFENDDKGYRKIRNVVEEKVYATLSNNIILLKLAIASIIQSMRNSPEQYIPLIRDNFPSTDYNVPYHPFYANGYNTQYFKTILLNDAVKVYNDLAKNLIYEILRYDISSPQSSLPLILSSDQELSSRPHK
jgi:DNA-binding CsgD family transcriptional regulator